MLFAWLLMRLVHWIQHCATTPRSRQIAHLLVANAAHGQELEMETQMYLDELAGSPRSRDGDFESPRPGLSHDAVAPGNDGGVIGGDAGAAASMSRSTDGNAPMLLPSGSERDMETRAGVTRQPDDHGNVGMPISLPGEMAHDVEAVVAAATGQGADGNSRRLLVMTLFTALAIAMHNLPEGKAEERSAYFSFADCLLQPGLATFVAAVGSADVGAVLAVAIAVHNIPEGTVGSSLVARGGGEDVLSHHAAQLRFPSTTSPEASCERIPSMMSAFHVSLFTSPLNLGYCVHDMVAAFDSLGYSFSGRLLSGALSLG